MNRRNRLSRVLTLLAVAALVAGCGSGSDTPAEPSDAEGGSPEPFTVAFTSIGLSSVGLLAAIDDLRAEGYEIETPEVADNNLIVQGVSTGEFDMSSGTTAAVLIATQQGAPLKIIGNRIGNEWTVVSTAEITECADMAGKRWAHHSEAAVGTVMSRIWVEENCPGTESEELIIAGSENRATALQADQTDATELELSDAIALLATEGDRFHVLTNFSETLPDLKPSTIYSNADFLAQHPDEATALLRAMLAQYKQINEDPAYLKELAEKYVPTVNADTIDTVTEQYVDLGLFETDGGVTEDNLDYTIQFFTDAGQLDSGLTVEQAVDLSFLEEAKGSS